MRHMSKITALAAACLISAGAAMGCGQSGSSEVTARSLLEDVKSSISEEKSAKSTLEVSLSAEGDDLASLGGSMDMSMNMDVETTTDPAANHMNGTLSAMGVDMPLEIYTVVDDGQINNYINMMDQWMVQTFSYDEDEVNSIDASADDLLKSVDSLTLDSETKQVDGKDAYIISGTISGGDIQNLLSSMTSTMSGLLGSTDELDLSGLNVDVEYAVSESDRTPLYIDLSFSGLDNLSGDSGTSITKLNEKITYKEFGTVDSITVPQDVKDSAVDINSSLSPETGQQ